jgi:hypothetical protein
MSLLRYSGRAGTASSPMPPIRLLYSSDRLLRENLNLRQILTCTHQGTGICRDVSTGTARTIRSLTYFTVRLVLPIT